jgi:hypothetical protein
MVSWENLKSIKNSPCSKFIPPGRSSRRNSTLSMKGFISYFYCVALWDESRYFQHYLHRSYTWKRVDIFACILLESILGSLRITAEVLWCECCWKLVLASGIGQDYWSKRSGEQSYRIRISTSRFGFRCSNSGIPIWRTGVSIYEGTQLQLVTHRWRWRRPRST